MKNSKTYKVKGMHCASCSSIIERTIKKIDGVEEVSVNPGTESASIAFDESKTSIKSLNNTLEPLGYTLNENDHSVMNHSKNNISSAEARLPQTGMSAEDMGMSEDDHREHLGLSQTKIEKLAEIKEMKSKLMYAVPLAVISIFVMAWDILALYKKVPMMSEATSGFFHHLLPIFATYILFVIGKPYLLGFYRFMKYGKANMDSLLASVLLLHFFIVLLLRPSRGI